VDFAVEDFRGCFASIGAELGYSTFVIGGVLGHSAKGVTERHYAARPDELLLTCADAVSAEVARRLGFHEEHEGHQAHDSHPLIHLPAGAFRPQRRKPTTAAPAARMAP
jgi:hypothetical protein